MVLGIEWSSQHTMLPGRVVEDRFNMLKLS